MADGTISYPFVGETKRLGNSGAKSPFVIRSAIGASEYSVEIPENGGRYDIAIPLAEISGKGTSAAGLPSSRDAKSTNPATTDKELVAALPDIAKTKPEDTAMLDSAFGVGAPEGPVQSPSYTMGIAKVNQLYREKNFELALIELNNILAFYPNSPKLLKMKGTLLIKTGNRELAMRAWQRAFDLAPGDMPLKRSIDRLNDRIIVEQNARVLSKPSSESNAPKENNGQTIPAH
jgi:tetratricopeptide (TPR) repeat protein